jgi:hypothetical protein
MQKISGKYNLSEIFSPEPGNVKIGKAILPKCYLLNREAK